MDGARIQGLAQDFKAEDCSTWSYMEVDSSGAECDSHYFKKLVPVFQTTRIFKIYFMEVQLIYNVVLISAVQQSDSVTHIYIFLFVFFSIMVYHRILSTVPCAIQQDLVVYPSYTSLHLLIPNSQSIPPPLPLPLGNHKSALYVCEFVSVSQIVHLCHILDSTYK